MGKSKKRRSPSPEWKNLEAQCLWPEQIAYEIIRPCQNWRIYAEEGLARRPADLWIYHDTLSIQFTTTLLAQYAVHYQTASHRLLEVGTYQAFPSPYQSPQLFLWQGEDILWRPAYKLDAPPRRSSRRRLEMIQYRLFSEEAE